MSTPIQDKKTIAFYETCAQEYTQKFMDLNLYKDSIEGFSALVQKNSRILDVGCGPGNVSKYLIEKDNSLRIIGVDYSKEMVKIASDNVPSARFIVCDARNLSFSQNSFDIILASFIAPYFNSKELDNFFCKLDNLLTMGGLVYFSCMEGRKSGYEKTSYGKEMELYVNYHSRKSIKKFLAKSGFKVIHFQEQPYPEPDGTFTTDLVFIAKKIKFS